MTLRHTLTATPDFATVVELVPWAGELDDARGQKPLKMAVDLAGDPRITALSVTDNAGGHARLSPNAPAEPVVALGHDVIVHVACRDRNRNGLQSLGWDLLSRGLTTVLAISGDAPVDGYSGQSKPVFDLDSVGLLSLYRELGAAAVARAAADGAPDSGARAFYLGAAVSNLKRYERELIPQYLKLGLKARSGAGFVIAQVGYDARKQDELLRAMRRDGIGIPAIANAYILDRGVARAFHAGRVPGCVVTDELLELVERRAAGPDRGRSFFLELAAKQLVVARGIGYRGIYMSGHRDASEVDRVLAFAEAFAEDDWRDLVADVTFAIPGAFHLFEKDAASGLNTDELSRGYRASITPAARRRARRRAPLSYRVNRAAHARVFAPGTPGYLAMARAYERVESLHLGKPLHALEQAVKVPLYDCRDCGDCSLPDVAYLCPESHCAKNQRNGPCGGSHDGRCEVGDRPCVWAEAYARLKPWGEELSMLDRPPVIQDHALRRTSAWANTFLGRDHFAPAPLSAAPAIAADGNAAPAAPALPAKGPRA
jgi:methylenetetrahydrofolate reductase (NADPH)